MALFQVHREEKFRSYSQFRWNYPKHCDLLHCLCVAYTLQQTHCLFLAPPLCWGLAVAIPAPHHVSFLPTCPYCLAFISPRGTVPHSDPSQAACPWIKGENYTEMSLKTCSSTPPQSQPSVIFYLALLGTVAPALIHRSLFFFFLSPSCCFRNTTLSAFKCVPLVTRFHASRFAGGWSKPFE